MGRLVNPAANLGNRHQHGVACDGVIGGLYAADAGGRHHAGLRHACAHDLRAYGNKCGCGIYAAGNTSGR
jgi:hypothetical protein